MIHPSTPEGAAFREALSGPGPEAHVLITGSRPCGCGLPGCQDHGVMITVGECSALATNRGAVELIVEALRDAAKFAWGEEGGGK